METTTMERRRLFTTENVGVRAVYRLLLVLYYRATRVPAAGEGRTAWLGMLAAELVNTVYWVVTQTVRWCPVRRRTFKDRLAERWRCVVWTVLVARPTLGTVRFYGREILCGRRFSKDYKEDWNRGIKEKTQVDIYEIEEKAKSLATCTYEHRTQWGNEIGIKYGCAVEDIFTGLAIHCRGWESVYINHQRAAFLGVGPATLAQTILQHKRWSVGNLTPFFPKHCSFLFGHGKIKLQLQMGYCVFGLWASSSLPTLYYVMVSSLGLVKGTPLFPEIMSPWATPFVYVLCVKNIYSIYEALLSGDTLKEWWNGQRMWMVRRITSYLYGLVGTIRKLLGLLKMTFAVTA